VMSFVFVTASLRGTNDLHGCAPLVLYLAKIVNLSNEPRTDEIA